MILQKTDKSLDILLDEMSKAKIEFSLQELYDLAN
jgi:hypothetical protein